MPDNASVADYFGFATLGTKRMVTWPVPPSPAIAPESNEYSNRSPVDYAFVGVDYSALDSEGKLRVRVSATQMAHARVQKSLILISPRV